MRFANKIILILVLLAFGSIVSAASVEFDQLKQGVVRITSDVTKQKGSGFVFRIDLDKHEVYIVTAAHLVAGDKKPKVEFFAAPDKTVQGLVTSVNEDLDLAIVLVSGNRLPLRNVTALTLSSSSVLSGGDEIVIIGSPRLGAPWSVIKGNVEAVTGGQVLFSGDIGEGVSGAPLLQHDRVVGIVKTGGDILRTRPATALPADIVSAFVRDYLPQDQGHGSRQLKIPDFDLRVKRIIDASYDNFEPIKGPVTRYEEKFGSFRFIYASTVGLPGFENKGILTESVPGGPTPNSVLEYTWSEIQDESKVNEIFSEIVTAIKFTLPKDWASDDYADPQQYMAGLTLARGFQARTTKGGPSVEATLLTDNSASGKHRFFLISLRFIAATVSDKTTGNAPSNQNAPNVAAEMDKVFDSAMKARLGMRSGLDQLLKLKTTSANDNVRQRSTSLLYSISEDYEKAVTKELKESGFKNAIDGLASYDIKAEPNPIPELIKVIRTNEDLMAVAFAFLAWRESTGQAIRIFDMESIDGWCKLHPQDCK